MERENVEVIDETLSFEDDDVLLEEMFVQQARGMSLATDSGGMPATLTLEDVTPSTLYFSDRPQRIVGHLTTEQFIGEWADGPDSFAADPPNAVLSFIDEQGVLDEAVVVLNSPSLNGGELEYSVRLLDGQLPEHTGPCTLFIDPIGRPLSPMSLAGVNRRQRRRERRRI